MGGFDQLKISVRIRGGLFLTWKASACIVWSQNQCAAPASSGHVSKTLVTD